METSNHLSFDEGFNPFWMLSPQIFVDFTLKHVWILSSRVSIKLGSYSEFKMKLSHQHSMQAVDLLEELHLDPFLV